MIREIWIGTERGYVCRISKRVFGEGEHGSLAAARKSAIAHAHAILRQQAQDGIPAGASMKERRRAYRMSLAI